MTTTSAILRGVVAAAALVATTAAVVVTSGSDQAPTSVDYGLEPAAARVAQSGPDAESPRAVLEAAQAEGARPALSADPPPGEHTPVAVHAAQPALSAQAAGAEQTPAAGPDSIGAPASAQAPANVVDWPSRGVAPEPAFLEKALAAFAEGLGATRSEVQGKVLFAGDDDSSNVYVFGQAWIKGSDAHTFGYSENGHGEATPFVGPVTGETPAVLAFAIAPGTGQTRETLVVIPKPSVARAYYGEAGSEYIEITGQEYLDGVNLIDRRPAVQGDMLKLLLVNGNKAFEGEVEKLLCGLKECG